MDSQIPIGHHAVLAISTKDYGLSQVQEVLPTGLHFLLLEGVLDGSSSIVDWTKTIAVTATAIATQWQQQQLAASIGQEQQIAIATAVVFILFKNSSSVVAFF